jgi:dihydrofolate reductase
MTEPTTTGLSHSTKPSTMPPPTKRIPSLTLILAATPSLGIGQAGTLPWPQLKKEMGYFARVTKRVPEGEKKVNAVIMGRKTWDSIPEKFRPLKARLNVVITRRPELFSAPAKVDAENVEGPIVAESILSALEKIEAFSQLASSSSNTSIPAQIHRIFVIGGSSIYKAALELPQADRILLTKIKKEYDCDTHFSVDVDKEGSGWVRKGREDLEEWTGENVQEGGLEQEGVGFEFEMYLRRGVHGAV